MPRGVETSKRKITEVGDATQNHDRLVRIRIGRHAGAGRGFGPWWLWRWRWRFPRRWRFWWPFPRWLPPRFSAPEISARCGGSRTRLGLRLQRLLRLQLSVLRQL